MRRISLGKLIYPKRSRRGEMLLRDRIFIGALNTLLKARRSPQVRNYTRCPKCESTFVEWNPHRRRHRCLMKACRWEEDEESLPRRSYISGRALEIGEILPMVLREFERGR